MNSIRRNLSGVRVLILQQRGWALRVGHPLACSLVREEGAIVGAVTIKPSTHEFIVSQNDIDYEVIISADEVKDNPASMGKLAETSMADVCKGLGVDTVWRLVQASRNHVTSYEGRYYYSFRQGQPDVEIENFIKGTYLHVKRCFDEFRPDIVVLPFFSGLQHIMFSLIARKRGVPLFGMIDSKVRGVMVFARDYLAQESDLLDRVEELRAGASSPNLEKAQKYLEKNRVKLAQNDFGISLATSTGGGNEDSGTNSQFFNPGPAVGVRDYISVFIRSLRECRDFYNTHRKEEIKRTGITIDYRPPRYIFRDNFSMLKYRRDSESYDGYSDLSRIGKFVYFPLQTQPEATLNVRAPQFTNQLEVARQIAMALPDDYCLVVKDHPGMSGKRPISYLDKLARMPNIKLLDTRVPTQQLLKRASLLVSPSSSTITEAAMMRVPTIQLGGLGTTRAYPNVTFHSDFTDLPSVIRKKITQNIDEHAYDEEMIRLTAAAYDVGLEDSHTRLYIGDINEAEQRELEKEVNAWFVEEIYNRLDAAHKEEPAA